MKVVIEQAEHARLLAIEMAAREYYDVVLTEVKNPSGYLLSKTMEFDAVLSAPNGETDTARKE